MTVEKTMDEQWWEFICWSCKWRGVAQELGTDEQPEQNPNADPAQGDTVGKIRAEADSTKLKQFLNNLDSE